MTLAALTLYTLVAAGYPAPAPLAPSAEVVGLLENVKLEHAFGQIRPTVIHGIATHYGPSYNGRTMGCGGVYRSADPSIVAVSPARYAEWPCGTLLEVTGPGGVLQVRRSDACPGCSANMIDLSESGSSAVCGGAPKTCNVQIRRVLR